MTSRVAPWLAAIAILFIGAMFLLRHQHHRAALALIRSETGASPRSVDPASGTDVLEPAGASANGADKLPEIPSRDLIFSDGARAARLWEARAEAIVFAKDRKEYGNDIARLLRMPYDKSWHALMALAEDGDRQALIALAHIGSACRIATDYPVRDPERPPSDAFHTLPSGWKPFVDALGRRQHVERDEHYSHCMDVGNPVDLMELAFDRYFRPDNPDALAEIAADNQDEAQAIADLRVLIARGAGTHADIFLGDFLIRQDDLAQQAEGRAMLERLGSDDPDVGAYLALCLAQGCGGFAADPDAARPWLESSAGSGNAIGFTMILRYLDQRGRAAEAWAWSLYGLDLALAGCLETLQPDFRTLAGSVENEARRRAALTAEQYNAGLATYYEISGRWEQSAKQHLACAD